MGLSQDDLRHELKFVADPLQIPLIEQWLASDPAGFFESFPSRQVNNVYFDTFDLDAYRDNVAGVSARLKLRFRWYGQQDDAGPSALEAKYRRAGLGSKHSFPTGAPVPLAGVPWREVRRRLRCQAADARVLIDQNPLPILINRYQRRYFETAERGLRVTLDWNQAVYDQRPFGTPNFRRRATTPDAAVVEFKFAPSDRDRARRVIQRFPYRLSRNSKYVIGVQAILNG